MLILRWCGFCLSFILILAVALLAFFYIYFNNDISRINNITDYKPKLVSKIYSASGELIGEFAREKRRLIAPDAIPQKMINAFIASEDKNFFSHAGIDYPGVATAIYEKIVGQRKYMRGASTITQQLAKSLLINRDGYNKGTERSLARKFKEAILARRLEAALTKQQILWLYLNQIYLGNGSYGIQAASEGYFSKNVGDLNLAQMALLAGLPQAPSRYSPIKNKKLAKKRQLYVLTRMLNENFISKEEFDIAVSTKIDDLIEEKEDLFLAKAPYFSEHIRRLLIQQYGAELLYSGGLTITTTINMKRQIQAQKALVKGLHQVDKRQGWRGPLFNMSKEINSNDILNKLYTVNNHKNDNKNAAIKVALVVHINHQQQIAIIDLGGKKGLLPLAGMRWARKINPNEYWFSNLVTDIKNVIKIGDVILVKPTTVHKLKRGAQRTGARKYLPSMAQAALLLEVQNNEDVNFFELEQIPLVQGAILSINNQSGYVEAMVGGYAYERSQFNRAYQACRQPGSVFKPIVYSAAISLKAFTPATMILDTPLTFYNPNDENIWKPRNFGYKFKGEVTVREALMNSMNIPTLRVMQEVGINKIIAWAKKLGIKSKLKRELGTAIGSSCVTLHELTAAYTTISRFGEKKTPLFITKIVDRHGQIILQKNSYQDPWVKRNDRLLALKQNITKPNYKLMTDQDAFISNYLLTEVASHGTAKKTKSLGVPVAGKTGTTNDNFDTWFIGYTPGLTTGVWVGYDHMKTPLSVKEQGGRTALPIWLSYMSKAVDKANESSWTIPQGICMAQIHPKTGKRISYDSNKSFVAPFKCGTEPSEIIHKNISTYDDELSSFQGI